MKRLHFPITLGLGLLLSVALIGCSPKDPADTENHTTLTAVQTDSQKPSTSGTVPIMTTDPAVQTSESTDQTAKPTNPSTTASTPQTDPTPTTTTNPSVTTPTSTSPSSTSPAATTTTVTTTTVTTTKVTVTTPAVTTEKPNDPTPAVGTAITVKYSVNNSLWGSLSGSLNQTIRYGQTKTTTVTATPNLGYKFTGWSDGVMTATRSSESFAENQNLVANFEIDALELPILYLTTKNGAAITSKEVYIEGTISVLNTEDQYLIDNLAMEIRGRGNYTWSSQAPNGKVPYKIKLSEKQNLLGEGNGKCKIWTLLADHCDQALLRNYTTLNFARSLSGIAWNSAARSVEVYLNGEYRGVFLLCEQNQVNKYRVNINDDIEAEPDQRGYLIELSGYAEDPYFVVSGTKYQIISDLSTNTDLFYRQYAYIEEYLWQCWYAVQGGDQTTIEQLIDIDSVIDTYLVEELFKNLDAGWDSFYMYKDIGGKLVFGPIWDFDQSGGNADEGCENYYDLRGGITNSWFKTFLQYGWFKAKLTARWNELKGQIDTIPDMIRTQAQAGYNSYCRNFERWPIFGQKINRETAVIRALKSYKEHYEYYANWMANRIEWLDEYWNAPTFSFTGELTLSGSGTAKDPYKVTSSADFLNFTACVLSGQTFIGKYFVQTADINMIGVKGYSGMGSSCTFAGSYDGGGHSITVQIESGDNSIFPYLTGKVYNVIAKGTVVNSGIAAGLCRSVRSGGALVNCISFVDVTSTGSNAGGITASNQVGAVISGCYFGGSLSSPNQTGPINVWYSGRDGIFISNFYAEGIANSTANVSLSREETAVADTKAGAQTAVDGLNSSLSNVASEAYLSASDLCKWVVVNNRPSLTAK
ncbi:MAG: CotH kinase family protein [Eubacteriales bacterium]